MSSSNINPNSSSVPVNSNAKDDTGCTSIVVIVMNIVMSTNSKDDKIVVVIFVVIIEAADC